MGIITLAEGCLKGGKGLGGETSGSERTGVMQWTGSALWTGLDWTGTHCVKHYRHGLFATEYCMLFALKKAYKGGVTGTPGAPPPRYALVLAIACGHFTPSEWISLTLGCRCLRETSLHFIFHLYNILSLML